MSNYRVLSALMAFTLALGAWPAQLLASGEGAEKPTLFTGDLGNIIWSLITFVAVLIVLGKFAWKPILGALQQREEFIRDSLMQAKKDREEAEVRLKEYADKISAAKDDATAIIEEGRRDAEVLRRKIEDDARKEADAILKRSKRELALATDTAIKKLYESAGKLATDIASKIIRKELDAKEHDRLVSDSITAFSKAANGNGTSAN